MRLDLAAITATYTVNCGDCGARMSLRVMRTTGKPFWGCSRFPLCLGAHGAHPSGAPMGTPADKATRQARVVAHAAFDAAWRARGMKRKEAYAWLRELTGLGYREGHISQMTAEQCRDLVNAITLSEAVRQCVVEASA
jgi:hypothetical protein